MWIRKPIRTWVVNSASTLFNDAIGEISPNGEWRWDGVQWNTYPQPTVPTPVVQTVGDRTYTTVHPDDFPNALNAHPYAAKGEGIQTRRPIFERLPASGTGFEYGCVVSKGEVKIFTLDRMLVVMKYLIIGVGYY